MVPRHLDQIMVHRSALLVHSVMEELMALQSFPDTLLKALKMLQTA